MGEEQARLFRQLINNLQNLEATSAHMKDVNRMLDKRRGAKLTSVDASSLVFLEQKKIATVWSTDHHLGLTGAQVLPRS
jgi:predicted nucleic acid-binding protein